MQLETKQVVGELYQSFRSFVESNRYEPLRYEALTLGEELLLGLGGQYTKVQIATHIKTLDAVEARKLIDSILDRSYRLQCVNKPDDTWPESLDELRQPITFTKCLSFYGVYNEGNDDDTGYENSTRYIEDNWLNLGINVKEAHIVKLFNGGSGSGFGKNLREMRSTLIENYLAQ